jgi:uncharacterized protein YggU (UPF0235/DUF167 family)
MPEAASKPWVFPHSRGSILSLTVAPRSSKSALELATDGSLRLRVAAPPVEGAANVAVLRFLADKLDVPLTRLTIVTGTTGRRKRILVTDMAPDELQRRLQRTLPGGREFANLDRIDLSATGE